MKRNTLEYAIFDEATPVAVTSSTDATPIVVTATSHGFSTGDLVIINGHSTNIAANGIFKIVKVNANSFQLIDKYTGENIAGTGGGAGSGGVVCIAPKILLVSDFRNTVLSVETSGSFNGTLKVAGSIGKTVSDTDSHGDTPNFGATQSKSNPYTYVQIINLDTASAVNGSSGITSAGTDLHNSYEVNTNGLKYLTVIPTAWSAGTITITAQLLDNL